MKLSWAHSVIILAGWILLSVFFAPELYLFFVYRKEDIPWSTAVVLTLANTVIAGVLAPGIVWLALKFPVGRDTWKRNLAVHIPACLLFSVVHSSAYALLCFASPIFHVLFTRFHPNLVTYWAVVGFVEAFRYFQAYKQRDQQLAQAQLQLLRAQLQPHFLFNTLHTISAMMHEDRGLAERMINRLSDLLRMTLDNIGRHEVPLHEELEFVRKYMEIEQARFGDGIKIEFEVGEQALGALVPSMSLQPLVENSVHHGFRAHGRTGSIRIEGRRTGNRLALHVIVNGGGLGIKGSSHGMGLANIRGRLAQLYPSDHTFELIRPKEGGTLAILDLPFRIGALGEHRSLPEFEHAGSHR